MTAHQQPPASHTQAPPVEHTATWQQPTQHAPVPAVYRPPHATDWVRDQASGVPVRVLRPLPTTTPAPEVHTPLPPARGVDPVAQRILAAGAVSPLVGWGGALLFGAMAGATTAIGLLAACLALAWLLRGTGSKQGAVNVQVRVDNRGR